MWVLRIINVGCSIDHNGAFYGDDSIMTHEFAASYQINPRFNVRYYANWNKEVNFEDGDHRIEFNYQF